MMVETVMPHGSEWFVKVIREGAKYNVVLHSRENGDDAFKKVGLVLSCEELDNLFCVFVIERTVKKSLTISKFNACIDGFRPDKTADSVTKYGWPLEDSVHTVQSVCEGVSAVRKN